MPASHLTIRPETPADHDPIDAILRAAFDTDAEARLVRALRRDPAFDPRLALVATLDDRPVGHILFTPAPIADADREHAALALAPMAVHPDHQRRAVGAALVRAGLDAARDLGHRLVHVLGHTHYYPRFGFEPAPPGIRCPFDPTGEHVMILALAPGALDRVRGDIRYARPFEDLA